MTEQSSTWPQLLNQLVAGTDLTSAQAAWAMEQVMSGSATSAQIAGFAIALRAKGETPAEVAGLAETMLARAKRVRVATRAVDIVGTGGDKSNSVNISTMASLVVAAAGIPVIKHGNRAASSQAGAADVLEALGISIELSPEEVERCIAELGIGFCFAPVFHPALRHAGATRRELGVPTTFNLLGPLTNPAQPAAALVGCAYPDKMDTLARVFAERGVSALVVRGEDGLDEITTTTTSTAWLAVDGELRKEIIDPSTLDIPRGTAEGLRGGAPSVNADVVRRLVAGERGPIRDAVVINAAGALAAHKGFSESLHKDLAHGLATANQALDSGAAAGLLARWEKFSGAQS